jgi:hypothetical protein
LLPILRPREANLEVEGKVGSSPASEEVKYMLGRLLVDDADYGKGW